MDEGHSLSTFCAVGCFDLQGTVGESQFLANRTSQSARSDSMDHSHTIATIGGGPVQDLPQPPKCLRDALASKITFNDAASQRSLCLAGGGSFQGNPRLWPGFTGGPGLSRSGPHGFSGHHQLLPPHPHSDPSFPVGETFHDPFASKGE